MFEIGKSYTIITTWEVGENGGMSTEHPNCEAIEIELPIVKFRQHGKEWTINVSSPVFAGAKPE
jgi:hypothetical protein